jgi:hypothetical protein
VNKGTRNRIKKVLEMLLNVNITTDFVPLIIYNHPNKYTGKDNQELP